MTSSLYSTTPSMSSMSSMPKYYGLFFPGNIILAIFLVIFLRMIISLCFPT